MPKRKSPATSKATPKSKPAKKAKPAPKQEVPDEVVASWSAGTHTVLLQNVFKDMKSDEAWAATMGKCFPHLSARSKLELFSQVICLLPSLPLEHTTPASLPSVLPASSPAWKSLWSSTFGRWAQLIVQEGLFPMLLPLTKPQTGKHSRFLDKLDLLFAWLATRGLPLPVEDNCNLDTTLTDYHFDKKCGELQGLVKTDKTKTAFVVNLNKGQLRLFGPNRHVICVEDCRCVQDFYLAKKLWPHLKRITAQKSGYSVVIGEEPFALAVVGNLGYEKAYSMRSTRRGLDFSCPAYGCNNIFVSWGSLRSLINLVPLWQEQTLQELKQFFRDASVLGGVVSSYLTMLAPEDCVATKRVKLSKTDTFERLVIQILFT